MGDRHLKFHEVRGNLARPLPGTERPPILYSNVTNVEIQTEDGWAFDLSDYNSLRLDEILPHRSGCTHELAFTTAIRITCTDLQARWDPSTDR